MPIRVVARRPEHLRGVCGDCDDITDWRQGTVPGLFGRRRAVLCTSCGNTLTQ